MASLYTGPSRDTDCRSATRGADDRAGLNSTIGTKPEAALTGLIRALARQVARDAFAAAVALPSPASSPADEGEACGHEP